MIWKFGDKMLRIDYAQGKLQIEGEVIQVIVKYCYNFSNLLHHIIPYENKEPDILTLSHSDENQYPPSLDKGNKKVFHKAMNFR